jgi:hypothetical protein
MGGEGSRPEPLAAWWVRSGGVKSPPWVVVVYLFSRANENEVRDVEDNLPTVVMEFVAETVNTHYLTM